MTISNISISACSGGNHITVACNVNGVPRTFQFDSKEFKLEPDEEIVRDNAIAVFRSAIKAALGAGATPAQIKNFLESRSFTL